MPKVLKDCVKKVKAQGHDEKSAYAICMSSLTKSGRISYDKEAGDWVDNNESIEVILDTSILEDFIVEQASDTFGFLEESSLPIKKVEISKSNTSWTCPWCKERIRVHSGDDTYKLVKLDGKLDKFCADSKDWREDYGHPVYDKGIKEKGKIARLVLKKGGK